MGRLTASQQAAIETRDANILVSAGAGSGKTTVLSERVLSLLKEGVDVDRLVVLTFTNAAAAEMRSRIRENIRKANLIEQEKRLDNAIIATFDSFAQRIVSEHRHLLSHPADAGIADPVLVKLEEDRLIQSILEEAYAEGDPLFLEEAIRLFDKTDDAFVQGIRLLIAQLRRLPNREAALDRYEEANMEAGRIQAIVADYLDLLNEAAKHAALEAQDLLALTSQIPKAQSYGGAIEACLRVTLSATTFSEHVAAAFGALPKAPTFGRDDPDKPLFAAANKRWKAAWEGYADLIKRIQCTTEEKLFASLLDTSRRAVWIYRLTRRFFERWEVRKHAAKLHQFHDVFDDALWLLQNGEGVAEKYRNSIEEILVDEYQDNNDLQEAFLDALGCKRRFHVGDVKQSIYGFRDANPKNFMAKADAYANHRGGELITLAANFRSRKEVLRDINRLFERLMDQAVGGADYRVGHALEFGNLAYEDEPKSEHLRGLSFLSYSVREDEAAIQVEADSIARHIRGLIESGYTVHDWQHGGVRGLAHGDIAIIADRKSAFAAYRDALTKHGIPVRVLADATFVAAGEIQTAANLLRMIRLYGMDRFGEDEFRRAFYGTSRSYAIDIDDNAVLTLFAAHRFQSHDDLTILSGHPTFAALDQTFRELAEIAKTRSVAELYEETAARFDLLGKTARLDDPKDAEAKLLYLQAKLASLEAFDLDSAIRYFEAIEASDDLDIDYVKVWDDDADAVTILTMHKAKGLEYPICYFPGLDKRFHTPETRAFFQFDPTYGLFAKATRTGFHDTPLHVLLEEQRRALDRSERMRLLYVALTRVKEAGYLLLNEALLEKIDRQPILRPAAERLKANKFSDWTTHFAVEPIPMYQAMRGEWTSPRRPLQSPAEVTPIVFRSLDFPPRQEPQRAYSAKTRLVDAPESALAYGEGLHEMLRGIDWHDSDVTGLNETERDVVRRLSALKVLGLPDAKHYREVPLMDEDDRVAILDLIVETDDELRVVDFKTQSIDHPEYRTQIANYCKLLRSRTTKRVSGILISLLTGDTLPVEVEDDPSVSRP